MRKFLLSVMALLAVGVAKADDKAWFLLTDTNVKVAADNVDYLLAADDDDHFTLVGKDGNTVADVKWVSLTQAATGIDNMDAGGANIVLPTKAHDKLQLSGLANGTEVSVFSVDGRLVKNAKTNGSTLDISVADLANGTYILKTPSSKVKFVKQ